MDKLIEKIYFDNGEVFVAEWSDCPRFHLHSFIMVPDNQLPSDRAMCLDVNIALSMIKN